MNFTEYFVESTDQTQLYVRVVGQGSPVLVLNGGPGLSHQYLLPQMDELAGNHQMVYFDQRGVERSHTRAHPNTINVAKYVEDIKAIQDRLGFSKIAIAGHSWGGLYALLYAIAHPQAVSKLVFLNSIPIQSTDIKSVEEDLYLSTLLKMKQSQAFSQIDPKTVESVYRELFRNYFYDPAKADELNLSFTPQGAVNSILIHELIKESFLNRPYDLIKQAANLDIPALVIHGENDLIPEEVSRQIHLTFENSTYVKLKNCGHFPTIESPHLLFKELAAFLNAQP